MHHRILIPCGGGHRLLALHGQSFQSTDWKTIAGLYTRLLQNNPNPFVELNYAIALYYSGQKQQALDALNKLQSHPFLNQYYLLNAALGKLHHLEGNDGLARQFFHKAYHQASFAKEKSYIQKQLDELK